MGSLTETLRLVIDGTSKGAQKALGDLSTKAKDTDGKLSTFGSRMNTASNYAAGAATVLTGIIAKSVATLEKQGAGIAGLKRQLDIATEGASLLSGEFQRYGIDAAAGGVGIKKLSQSIDEARNGSATAAAVFERLGISVEQLKTMSDTEAILATRDALAEMGAGADRTNMAVKLLGRGALSLSAWYSESAKGMAETNQTLKDSGMVWSDDDLAQYKEAMKAQREMQIALTGIQLTIARDVLPALTPLIQQFGSLLRTLRPFMGIIVPLTAGLWAFSGAVKAVRMVQFITGLGRTQGALRGVYRALRTVNFGALVKGMAGYLKAIPGIIAANASLALSYTAVGAAAAAAGFAVYEAIKAYMSWQDAVGQANQAQSNANATNEQAYAAGKLTQAQYESNKAGIARDAYKTPWYMQSPVNVIPGLATEGLVKSRPGGTIVRVAEGGEDEFVLKRSRFAKRSAGSADSVLVTGNTFVGTSRDAERTLTNIVSRRLGPRTARLTRGRMAMANG